VRVRATRTKASSEARHASAHGQKASPRAQAPFHGQIPPTVLALALPAPTCDGGPSRRKSRAARRTGRGVLEEQLLPCALNLHPTRGVGPILSKPMPRAAEPALGPRAAKPARYKFAATCSTLGWIIRAQFYVIRRLPAATRARLWPRAAESAIGPRAAEPARYSPPHAPRGGPINSRAILYQLAAGFQPAATAATRTRPMPRVAKPARYHYHRTPVLGQPTRAQFYTN